MEQPLNHYSLDELAEHWMSYRVGRTASSMPNATYDKDAYTNGLLVLILRELRKTKHQQEDPLIVHGKFLNDVKPDLLKALAGIEKEIARISGFCNPKLLGRDACADDLDYYKTWCPRQMSQAWRALDRTRCKLSRLKSVRSIDDVTNLSGIGKTKAAKIKTDMAKI